MITQPVDDQSTGCIQSSTMTTPPGTKTIRVAPETHKQLHDLASRLGGTADDALRHLLGLSTVRVPVMDTQRERWIKAAQDVGVTVEQWVMLRAEAALQFGNDPTFIGLICHRVNGLSERVDGLSTAVHELSTAIHNRPQQ